jgi:hypothetical protein
MALFTLTGLRTAQYALATNDTVMISDSGVLSVTSDAIIDGASDVVFVDVINHGSIFSESDAIDLNGEGRVDLQRRIDLEPCRFRGDRTRHFHVGCRVGDHEHRHHLGPARRGGIGHLLGRQHDHQQR